MAGAGARPTRSRPDKIRSSLGEGLSLLEFSRDRNWQDPHLPRPGDCDRRPGCAVARPNQSSDRPPARRYSLSRQAHYVLFSADDFDSAERCVVPGVVRCRTDQKIGEANPSREAAEECSPGRKPWVDAGNEQALKRTKERFGYSLCEGCNNRAVNPRILSSRRDSDLLFGYPGLTSWANLCRSSGAWGCRR